MIDITPDQAAALAAIAAGPPAPITTDAASWAIFAVLLVVSLAIVLTQED